MGKIVRIFLLIIQSATILVALCSCVGQTPLKTGQVVESDNGGYLVGSQNSINKSWGLIVPHHLLVKDAIDEQIAFVAKQRQFKKIVIISPNHFNSGFSFIQTNSALIKEKLGLSLNRDSFKGEHGVNNLVPILKKYFQDAEIYAIIIKEGAPNNNLLILANRLNANFSSDTLFIGSMDFTHYAAEDDAIKNDNRTIDWIKHWASEKGSQPISWENIYALYKSFGTAKDAISMDSPETFFVFFNTMKQLGNFNYSNMHRTSSAEISKNYDKAEDNTSHLYAIFN